MQNTAQISLTDYHLICQGEWDLRNISELQTSFSKITWPNSGKITIDGADIQKIDASGAWLMNQFIHEISQRDLLHQFVNFSAETQHLVTIVSKQQPKTTKYKQVDTPNWFARVGITALKQLDEFVAYLEFVGKLATEFLRVITHPKHIRWRSLFSAIDRTGYTALPIIGLLSFMIGVVLAYQMGSQLRNYGANVFIVDLLGLSVLREFGPLLTAIMIAGRTGSAYTAQLGLMKANQEIDALDTMGITPAEILLLPRIFALAITLPLLTIWADIFGIIGGMFMANNMLNITWFDFLHRFQNQVPLSALIIGLGKSPIFALIIASIGCFQGVQVHSSAESIGANTTKSVVLAIFFIIVADAFFSIIFSKLQI